MFRDRTVYDREAMTVLMRALRRTLGRRRSMIFDTLLWIVLAVFLIPTLIRIGMGDPIELWTVMGIAAAAALMADMIFQDQIRGWIAWRRSLPAMREVDYAFDRDGFTISIRNAQSRWGYGAFQMFCETDRWFVFLVDPRHGLVFDKSGFTEGDPDAFRAFIEERTGKTFVPVR